jgi:hypothetical protein
VRKEMPMPKISFDIVAAAMLLLFGAATMPVPAAAQPVDPERLALAKTFLDVSQPPVTIQQLGDIVSRNLIQLNPDLKDQITATMPNILPRFDPYMTTLKEDVARVYAARFTAPDLKAMIAFYQTPAGQKFGKESPVAAAEADQIARRWGTRIGEDMTDAVNRELAAQGKTLKLPPPKQ